MEQIGYATDGHGNSFYCKDAGEQFLEAGSVDLFIGHPPYYQAELELNGGNPEAQMQNAVDLEEYYGRLILSIKHMEYALKDDGNIFIALDNTGSGLGIIPRISAETALKLQSIRLWDYSTGAVPLGNQTVVFAHYRKEDWYPANTVAQGPFVLTNLWDEAYAELAKYNQEYATVGAAPTGIYREMIKNYSSEGQVVCDLFAGCGTVQVVAMELGRKFIYNDVSEDKFVMARKRIDDLQHYL